MSGSDDSKIYWDACIFIAHFKNETRPDPLDMQGVQELVKKIDEGKLHLVTSVITLTEVLQSHMGTENQTLFKQLFQRRNCHLVDVTSKIAEISHDIRDYYQQQKQVDNLPTVTTADAIHLATAIDFSCSHFYTFDENDERNKRRALIPLGPTIGGKYTLPTQKPIGEELPFES